MKKLFYILALGSCFLSCKKYRNASDFKGKFVGNLKIIGSDYLQEMPTAIILNEAQFEVITSDKKFGNGTFNVEDKLTISFADTNVWTEDFDHNIILNGSYTYQTLGDSLILTKIITSSDLQNRYQYRLRSVKN